MEGTDKCDERQTELIKTKTKNNSRTTAHNLKTLTMLGLEAGGKSQHQ